MKEENFRYTQLRQKTTEEDRECVKIRRAATCCCVSERVHRLRASPQAQSPLTTCLKDTTTRDLWYT